jgi:signal recognition particle GTPase
MLNFSVGQHFVPLVITMVGLPARGKTILAYKIQQYLNWTNHKAKGMYEAHKKNIIHIAK